MDGENVVENLKNKTFENFREGRTFILRYWYYIASFGNYDMHGLLCVASYEVEFS